MCLTTCLKGDLRKAQTTWDYITVFRMSVVGMFITHNVLWFMQLLHLVPKGTFEVGETLRQAGAALVAGGQKKVRFLFLFVIVD